MGTKGKVCGVVLSVLGLVLLIAGVAVKLAFPSILESQVYANLKLENGTEGWDAFVSFL
jgi:hypothetical protein